ncbi:uncharacterized protein [Paramisgurnus dabryanus]|uniref:uncharacterized protein n=1 Tax=Paramisgurnus dabryanus TaxID=90735 RepID=UPI0031F39462
MASSRLYLRNTEGGTDEKRGDHEFGDCSDRFPGLTIHQSRDSLLFAGGKFVKASLIQTLDESPKGCLTLSNTEGRINMSRGVSGPKVGGCSDRFPDLTIHQSRDSSLFPDGKSKTPFIYTLDDSPKACLTLNNTKGGVVDGLKVGVCSDRFPDLNTCQSRDSSLFAERKIVRERFIDTVDDSPKVGSEGKGARIRGLFKRACKAVARPFLSCRRNKVKPIVPPLKPDKSSSGLSVQYASSPKDSLDSGSYWVGDTSDACPAQVKSSAKVWSMADQTSYTDSFEETHVLNTSDIASASLDDSADHRKGVEELMNAPSGSIETLSLDAHSAVKASSRAVKRRSLSADSRSSEMTDESLEATNLDFEYGMNMAEICPEEQCAKKKKKAGKWGFLKRTCKAIERTFFSCGSTKVEPFVPPLRPDTSPSYQESLDDDVETYYNLGNILGEGCFGSVCEATRISDGQQVAIKLIPKYGDERTLAIPGYSDPLITEVALMIKMSEPPLSPNVIQMFESFEDDEKIAIVMEYPQPCITLEDYITDNEMLCEEMARIVMHKLVKAVIDCIDHGVVHTDIHPGNILINTSTLDMKLIDFSCGQLFTSDAYDSSQYVGKQEYCPPEVTEMNRFHAISANVWSLGLVLFEMVNGCLPYSESEEVLFVNPDLSIGLDLKVLDTTQD